MNVFSERMFAGCFVLILLAAYAHSQVKYEKATFAGGCFWCMTPPFEKLNGVKKVVAGYTGGTGLNPTYEDYTQKGHVEAVDIVFDPSVITYTELLNVFWMQINPTDGGGQFCDRGPEYRSAVFFHNAEQKRLAEKSKENLGNSGKFNKSIVTEIVSASTFYPAEEYHQDYYKKNPIRYKFYRFKCGRDQFLEKIWGKKNEAESAETGSADPYANYKKPDKEELKKILTPLQYKVTQENRTEPAFNNEYWNNHREGIYVDVVSGEPLFSSTDKFDSGTGWPSFTKPLEPGNIEEKNYRLFFKEGTEVHSKHANSHLGDVFNDGPPPTGMRYCIDSASLRFIPKEDLGKEGYGKYKKLFEKSQ